MGNKHTAAERARPPEQKTTARQRRAEIRRQVAELGVPEQQPYGGLPSEKMNRQQQRAALRTLAARRGEKRAREARNDRHAG